MPEAHAVPEKKLVQPNTSMISAHHGTVRFRLVFDPDETRLPPDTFYGYELTPNGARDLARRLLEKAELAERE